MHENYLIDIKGTVISDSGTPDVIELVTSGRYYIKNGQYYITYKESEATGFEGVTTTVNIDGEERVTLSRNGSARSTLILEKGKRHLCQYETGFGQLVVGVSGCRIKTNLNELGGELAFYYTLDINSSQISQNEVCISVKEAHKSNAQSVKYSN